MCLSKTKNIERVGYKLFSYDSISGAYSPIYALTYCKFRIDYWYVAIMEQYVNNKYHSGFHIIETLKDVKKYYKQIERSDVVCVKVRYTGVLSIGEQHGVSCVVASKMKLLNRVNLVKKKKRD